MNDSTIMQVRLVGLPNLSPAHERLVTRSYHNALTAYFLGDVESIDRCLEAAQRILLDVSVYASDIPESNGIVSDWEEANLYAIQEAFKDLGNTGCAYFELEFWSS
jgi:hypothetical protein